MKIQEEIKKCVVYVGLQMPNGDFRAVGTGFFISNDFDGFRMHWLVTAKHVIEGIKGTLVEHVLIRINKKAGTSEWYSTDINNWRFHKDETVDIAIYSNSWEDDWDHLTYPIVASMTQEQIEEYEIGVGDEIFITGLFKHHHGKHKNIPIVRIGNIAAMPEEKVQTVIHLMDAYLIEVRSIGGLSGSPVFINLRTPRIIGGLLTNPNTGYANLLMGLISGHYDEDIFLKENISDETKTKYDRVNTGIAFITPVSKIIELIEEINPMLKPLTKDENGPKFYTPSRIKN